MLVETLRAQLYAGESRGLELGRCVMAVHVDSRSVHLDPDCVAGDEAFVELELLIAAADRGRVCRCAGGAKALWQGQLERLEKLVEGVGGLIEEAREALTLEEEDPVVALARLTAACDQMALGLTCERWPEDQRLVTSVHRRLVDLRDELEARVEELDLRLAQALERRSTPEQPWVEQEDGSVLVGTTRIPAQYAELVKSALRTWAGAARGGMGEEGCRYAVERLLGELGVEGSTGAGEVRRALEALSEGPEGNLRLVALPGTPPPTAYLPLALARLAVRRWALHVDGSMGKALLVVPEPAYWGMRAVGAVDLGDHRGEGKDLAETFVALWDQWQGGEPDATRALDLARGCLE